MFEEFIDYCNQDNPDLAKDICTWIADFFDLPNRTDPLTRQEYKWIKANMSPDFQQRVLGYDLKQYKERW